MAWASAHLGLQIHKCEENPKACASGADFSTTDILQEFIQHLEQFGACWGCSFWPVKLQTQDKKKYFLLFTPSITVSLKFSLISQSYSSCEVSKSSSQSEDMSSLLPPSHKNHECCSYRWQDANATWRHEKEFKQHSVQNVSKVVSTNFMFPKHFILWWGCVARQVFWWMTWNDEFYQHNKYWVLGTIRY